MANSKPERPGEGNFGTVIGIDLGTTYSCVGYYSDNHVEIIENDQGNNITPSFVAFTEHGERLVGDAARDQLTINPENTVFNVKRLIGRKWDDLVVQDNIKNVPFKVFEKESKPYIRVRCGGKTLEFAPEQISAMVLERMKVLAEERLGQKVTHAVITIPAYFNDAQRQATKDAARIAGLKVLRLLNEPTAVAIDYGLDKGIEGETFLVFSLGAGGCDVAVIKINHNNFNVIAVNGDPHIGGNIFDQMFLQHLLCKHAEFSHIAHNEGAKWRMRIALEETKRRLSSALDATAEMNFLQEASQDSGIVIFHRDEFDSANKDAYVNVATLLDDVLNMPNEATEIIGTRYSVTGIIFGGGSTRIPKIEKLAQEHSKATMKRRVNVDTTAVSGAAKFAANVQRLTVQDRSALSHHIRRQEYFRRNALLNETIKENVSRLATGICFPFQQMLHTAGGVELYNIGSIVTKHVCISQLGLVINDDGMLQLLQPSGSQDFAIEYDINISDQNLTSMIKDRRDYIEFERVMKAQQQHRDRFEKLVYSCENKLKEANLVTNAKRLLGDEMTKPKSFETLADLFQKLDNDLSKVIDAFRSSSGDTPETEACTPDVTSTRPCDHRQVDGPVRHTTPKPYPQRHPPISERDHARRGSPAISPSSGTTKAKTNTGKSWCLKK